MKKLFLLIMILCSIQANTLIQAGSSIIQTEKPKQTDKIYLGSFLAQGHVPASSIYQIDIPLSGIIKELPLHLYAKVQKGDKLLTIKSPDLLELESNYINLVIQKEYYANEVRRLEPLYKANVVAKKIYLQAKNMLIKFESQSDFYYNLLLEYGITKATLEHITQTKKPIADITIYAPTSGKIEDLAINPHMFVQKGSHLLTIINTNNTHYEVALPKRFIQTLHIGSKLYSQNQTFTVESIADVVDKRTQTIAVHLVPEKRMKILPNEKKNLQLYLPHKAFILPPSAVIEIHGSDAVFVKKAKGFEVVPVVVLSRSSESVYIVNNTLTKDSQVATKGVIALKGALEANDD